MASNINIQKINCYIESLECFGLFVGMSLASKNAQCLKELKRIKDSIKFFNAMTEDLEKFVSRHEYTVENLEMWFSR